MLVTVAKITFITGLLVNLILDLNFRELYTRC